jgi:predicted DNA-binding protein
MDWGFFYALNPEATHMAKVGKDLPQTIPFRATAEDRRRLDALAEMTHRTRSGVLRLLLEKATLTAVADISLTPLLTDEPDDEA